jgi:hypothetical protein
MAKQLPTIDMILEDSSEYEFSSDDEIVFYSPIKPTLIKTDNNKCTDKECYFCSIIKSDCSNNDISVFKNNSK